MEQRIMNFIQQFVLKAGEKLGSIEEQDGIQVLTIVKHSVRIYKKVAQIKVAKNLSDDINIPNTLKKYKFTIKAKRQLDEPFETIYEWLKVGWILREIRYNVDGISVKEDFYRMGPTYQHVLLQQKNDEQRRYKKQIELAIKRAHPLQMSELFKNAIKIETMPNHWSKEKKLKFIHFCIAFYELAHRKDLFDFKEIGATYEDRIGGSKLFDSERVDFLEQLERQQIDVQSYGLVSKGKVVPIFFTGNAHSYLASYQIGAVHATTDNAVLQTTFATTNTRLWLVENRAILTRMAVEVDFLRETNSFVLCLDGQIKSAHKQFIKQLLNSSIQQAFVWTDYDEAGVTIAKYAVQILSCPYKIIGRNAKTFTSITAYEQSYLEEGEHEQEQQLGGVEEWKGWM